MRNSLCHDQEFFPIPCRFRFSLQELIHGLEFSELHEDGSLIKERHFEVISDDSEDVSYFELLFFVPPHAHSADRTILAEKIF